MPYTRRIIDESYRHATQLIMPKCHVEQWLNALNQQAMNRFDINIPSLMAALLAQVAHKSAKTTIVTENLNY